MHLLFLLISTFTFASFAVAEPGSDKYFVPYAANAPVIDAAGQEQIWQKAQWRAIDQLWLGPEYSKEDFQGRFKVVWKDTKIFILVELIDDVLYDAHRDPFEQYWDDDCLEIFIDEDRSGGNHQFNHNAFAYHIALDNQTIDIGLDKKPINFSHHVQSKWKQVGNKIIWEVSIDIYDDAYQEHSNSNKPVTLTAGKIMGFMIAYCDNDGSELRENFIGSEAVSGDKKDRGYIDADIFGALELVE